MRLAAIILAAGYSSRMHEFKPLLQLGGKSLIGRAVELFKSAGVDEPLVVVGHKHFETSGEARRYFAKPVLNKKFDDGMFSSIQTGVSALDSVDGFFVLPVDIPLVRPSTIEALISAFDKTAVVRPLRDGFRGHPPLIPAHLISDILQSDGQGGLKSILAGFQEIKVDVWDDGPFIDADSEDDFYQLCKKNTDRNIGSKQEVEAIAALNMPPKGIAHGVAVANVACCMAKELIKKGYSLNMEIIHNSSLLHDVGKGHPDHEKYGADLIAQMGLDMLVEPIGSHRGLPPVPVDEIGEKELVCLADKLVKGNKRISIQQRFKEKLLYHSHDQKECGAIRKRFENLQKLQQAVEKAADKSIEDILKNCQL